MLTIEHVNMDCLSSNSQRAYSRWLREYLAFSGECEPATALTVPHMKAWFAHLKARGLSYTSFEQSKAAVVFMAQALADQELCDHSAAAMLSRVKVPRMSRVRRAAHWLTRDEARRLLDSIHGRRTGVAERNRAIMLLFLVCGLRSGEIINLEWQDVIEQGNHWTLWLLGKGSKRRQVKLPESVKAALDIWHAFQPVGARRVFTQADGNAITSNPLSYRRLYMIVREISKGAGLTNVAPHDLRRTFARGAYEAGASFEIIRQTLGHAHMATTEHYVNATFELENSAPDIWLNALDSGVQP